MHWIRAHVKPYLSYMILGPAFKLVEAVLELFMPIFMALIIDNGIAAGDTGYVFRMGGVMLGVALTGFCCAMICQYSASIAAQGFGASLRASMFSRVTHFSARQFELFSPSTVYARITNDVTAVGTGINMAIRLLLRVPFVCLGSLVATLLIDWHLGLIVLAVLPIFSFCLYFIMRRTSPMYTQVQAQLDEVGKVVGESVSGVMVVRAYAAQQTETQRFAATNARLVQTAVRVGKFASALNPFTTFILNLAILLIVWFGGVRIDNGAFTTGELLAFISYVTQMLSALAVAANLIVIFARAYASGKRIDALMRVEPQEAQADDTAQAGVLEHTGGADVPALVFEDVTFTYGGGEPELQHISFCLRRGERLGIIGATGAGKSTLVKLILGFYEPSEGTIRFHGVDIRDIPVARLRRSIGYVPQKIQLFSGTVADNLRVGCDEADESRLRAAARAAQADTFIEAMPDGYETYLDQGGANLSGGQRQRLAIARALMRRSELLILDDAASALDYATDLKLRKALAQTKAAESFLFVSQRISAVQDCDQILVLQDGRAAGLGTHEQLLKTCAEYASIVRAQTGGGSR